MAVIYRLQREERYDDGGKYWNTIKRYNPDGGKYWTTIQSSYTERELTDKLKFMTGHVRVISENDPIDLRG